MIKNNFRKKLGQNFLIDQNVIFKIIKAMQLNYNDVFLEFGAGSGFFSKYLRILVKKIYLIEIDNKFCHILKNKFLGKKNVFIINDDFFKFNFKKFFKYNNFNIRLFGSIPYNISSKFFSFLLNIKKSFKDIHIVVQYDFIIRIISKKILYMPFLIWLFLKIKIFFTISKFCFYPRPKIKSAFIRIKTRKERVFLNKKVLKYLFINKKKKILKICEIFSCFKKYINVNEKLINLKRKELKRFLRLLYIINFIILHPKLHKNI